MDGTSYHHPSGEINVWLPLNLSGARGSNSLWRDATPWSGPGTSQPVRLQYGQALLFYGNRVPHETRRNTTGITRCSFDFRFIPGSLFRAHYHKHAFSEASGYWTRMEITGCMS